MSPVILTAAEWSNPDIVGMFAGVENKDYHAAHGVSSTHIKRLDVSAAYSQLSEEFSEAGKKSIDLGNLVHGFTLEDASPQKLGFVPMPEMWDVSGYAQRPEGMKFTTPEGKAWKAEQVAAGKTVVDRDPVDIERDKWLFNLKVLGGKVLDPEQLMTARAVEAAIYADPEARRIASRRGLSELSMRAFDPDLGLMLKARFDYAELEGEDPLPMDIKTTWKGVDPESFGYECDARGYLLQVAHYLHVAKLCGVDYRTFRFVAANTEAPYEVACHDFGPSHPSWNAVNERLFALYALHSQCVKRGQWPKNRWKTGPVVVPRRSKFWAPETLGTEVV